MEIICTIISIIGAVFCFAKFENQNEFLDCLNLFWGICFCIIGALYLFDVLCEVIFTLENAIKDKNGKKR